VGRGGRDVHRGRGVVRDADVGLREAATKVRTTAFAWEARHVL